jgi:hypothetical protein
MTDRNQDYEERDSLEAEKSAEIIYNEIVRLYELGMESHDNLKDKSNSIIMATGTIITLVTLATIQLLNLNLLSKITYGISFVFIPYFLLIFSLIFAVKSYRVRELDTVSAQEFLENYYREPKITLLDQLASNIADDTYENNKKAEERKKFVDYAMTSLEMGIIIFALIFVIFIIILIY